MDEDSRGDKDELREQVGNIFYPKNAYLIFVN